MTAPDQILDILRKAYQIEVDGYTFYSMTADRADKPAVQELFGKLAQDEVQHQAFLRSVLKNYHDKGVEAFSMGIVLPDLRAFSDKVFTDRFREQAEGAAFEMAALSVGMTLEKNAVAYFSGRRQDADRGRGAEVLPVPRRLGTAAPRRAAVAPRHDPRRFLGEGRLLAVLTRWRPAEPDVTYNFDPDQWHENERLRVEHAAAHRRADARRPPRRRSRNSSAATTRCWPGSTGRSAVSGRRSQRRGRPGRPDGGISGRRGGRTPRRQESPRRVDRGEREDRERHARPAARRPSATRAPPAQPTFPAPKTDRAMS